MSEDIILHAWYDDHGDLYRVGRRGSRYFVESVVPAFEPRAGEVARKYVTKAEAEAFDPDPTGELNYA